MFGYIYRTHNKVNGKMYIGKKIANRFLENEYLGSGKILRNAVNKYGKDNFYVELLETIDSNDDYLCERERYWISKFNADKSENYYNISAGGKNPILFGKNNPRYGIGNPSLKGMKRPNISKKKFGTKHSEESKRKMSIARKNNLPEFCQRKNNPMLNTCWVHKDNLEIAIDKTNLDKYIKDGYSLGRLNKMWITDGKITKQINVGEEIPVGFRKGRIIPNSNPGKGMVYITNGTISRRVSPEVLNNLPNGWYKGLARRK